MLKKRIIACLDVKDGRTVKGTNFLSLKDAGDPVELALKYVSQDIDELVFLDISASNEKRKTLLTLVEKVSAAINIPFTVGGGISNTGHAAQVIGAGADKVSINSAAVNKPELITSISRELGSQAVVVAIDVKKIENQWKVFTHGGQRATDLELFEWAEMVQDRGAGEILLTSMDHDGTGKGFAIEILKKLSDNLNIPLIASGGAGEIGHFEDLFKKTRVSAALAAGIFHYEKLQIPELKKYLRSKEIAIR